MGDKTVDDLKSDSEKWNAIDWQKAYANVNRLQARIVKAVQAGEANRVRGLQRLLTRSHAAKVIAVKRVTSNRGKNTPGVDGVIWKTPAQKWQAAKRLNRNDYKPQPLRRHYIPKKNGKKRPLGIPTKDDRAEQALELLALDPVAESTADGHSYGFRKKRSTHDAVAAAYNALRLNGSPVWIFEGDIKGCFDNIDHEWMIKFIPMNKIKLSMWLKAGYLEKGMFNPTTDGTPQGGIISPILANMVLDGLEDLLKKHFRKVHKIHLVRFADDFIITGCSKELLENEVMPLVNNFLKERGLQLSLEKTKVTHIGDGFDFLGFNFRKYNGTLRIKPAKSNIKAVKQEIREVIKANKTAKTVTLINLLNPIIRGWGNYYRYVVSNRVFHNIDHAIWQATWRWANRRHPNKSKHWIKRKYYQPRGNRRWVFKEKTDKVQLFQMANIPIRRFIKIRADANPYDPVWNEYFAKRWFHNKGCVAISSFSPRMQILLGA